LVVGVPREDFEMPDVFAYGDYRKFLKDAYLEKKRTRPSGFTHRLIGRKGGFDPGLFSKVVQGQRNISVKLIPGFCRAFGLQGPESEYFEALVHLAQAATEADRAHYGEKAFSLKNRFRAGLEVFS
jgi:uncharacterized protein (TIGR02147 family)